MIIRVPTFQGESPRTTPRLLPDSMAQLAFNTKLDNGTLNPVHQAKFTAQLDQAAQTIYLHKGQWLGWDAIVDAVPGPVADDRLYYTGDGVPKIRYENTVYNLAIARPEGKPVATVIGDPDDDLGQSILYAYTWVSDLGEESEPSPLSESVYWSSGLVVNVDGFSYPPENRRITKMRIYRSQTASTGATDLYFIAERDASTTTFVDDNLDAVEPIPSTDWNAPPDNLTGLTALPNGMMAAFAGKKLYFSEPFYPHAWPEKYILTTDYDIVGLGAFGSSIAIMTTGQPYVVSGTTPENMVMEKLELNLPCVNARSIVDLGYSVAYASHLGLVSVSSAGANIVTGGILTREQWQDMKPQSFIAGQYAGRWMASYLSTDTSGEEKRQIVIIDLTGDQTFIIRNSDSAQAMHYDIESGALFMLREDTRIYEWDALNEPFQQQQWRSKLFIIQSLVSFGAILIESVDAVPVSGDDELDLEVLVYADKKLVWTTKKINKAVRMPGGFQARTWEIEARGTVAISTIIMATSPSEIAEGA